MPTLAAKLREPKSGRVLTVTTDQPGIQIYTGNFLFGQKGKDGKEYKQRSTRFAWKRAASPTRSTSRRSPRSSSAPAKPIGTLAFTRFRWSDSVEQTDFADIDVVPWVVDEGMNRPWPKHDVPHGKSTLCRRNNNSPSECGSSATSPLTLSPPIAHSQRAVHRACLFQSLPELFVSDL